MSLKRLALLLALAAAAPARADITLLLATGESVHYRDITDGCPDQNRTLIYARCHTFRLAQDIPAPGFFLVIRAEYESHAWLLVHRQTGRVIEVLQQPRFSPDGTRFLVINDSVADSHEHDLQIWRLVDDGAELEWAHALGKSGQTEAALIGPVPPSTTLRSWRDDRIELTYQQPGWYDVDGKKTVPERTWPATLARERGTWQLTMRTPEAVTR